MQTKPITIIGGGLAGLTLGLGLRRQAIPVTIWEARHYPRHRVCGEFISGRGLQVLWKLGLLKAFAESGAVPARTAAFSFGNRLSPVRALPESAMCLSRYAMDSLLAEKFRQAGGVLREGERCAEEEAGEGMVHASGRRLEPLENGWRWFGLKAHVCNLPMVADLEMYLVPEGYVGLCQLRDGINVCGLFRRHARASGLSRRWQELLGGPPNSALHARLAHAEFDESSFCSVSGLALRPQRSCRRLECCIGDALTMIPPLTGNGMSMAFESAGIAIEPLASYSRGEISWSQAQRTIAQNCDLQFAGRLAWAKWMHWLIFTPILQKVVGSAGLRSNLVWRTMFVHTR